MTNDLKTLKDIEFVKEDNQDGYVPMCYSDELRSEAIKWIKELEKSIKEIQHNPESYNELMKDYYGTGKYNELLTRYFNQILWIK